MPLEFAVWLVRAVYAYVIVGLLLLPWWQLRGLKSLDTTAASGPWGFRILISFGLIGLWPWLLPRAMRGLGHPAPERNAHRDRAQPQGETTGNGVPVLPAPRS